MRIVTKLEHCIACGFLEMRGKAIEFTTLSYCAQTLLLETKNDLRVPVFYNKIPKNNVTIAVQQNEKVTS